MSDASPGAYQPSLADSLGSLRNTAADPLSHDKYDVSGLQRRSRKRRPSISGDETFKNHKRSCQYIPAYHTLYNTTVEDILDPIAAGRINESWDDNRIELSYWTVREKEAFFIALERKGRHDIKAISRLVISKSETEVRSFILSLQNGCAEASRTADRFALTGGADIPSASEVGERCERALESAADALAQRQLTVEEAIERKRHGDWWLLNAETIVDLDEAFSPNERVVSAMELLNIRKMVDLSSKFFMNSAEKDGNWRTFDQDDAGPALYCTALLDFYNLVVGITKRAISSAIFLAMSRHKLSHTDLGRNTEFMVKHRDVQAACELLGLETDRRKRWIGLARRCNLAVYQEPLVSAQSLPYEEVEQILTDEGDPRYAITDNPQSHDEVQADLGNIALLHDGRYQVDEDEDKQMETLDAAQSREDEDRLWNILGQEDIHQVRIKDEPGLDKPRLCRQSSGEPMDNWSDKIKYRADWQLPNGSPFKEEFLIKKRQQRKRTVLGEYSSIDEAFSASDATDAGDLDTHSSASYADISDNQS